MMFRIGLWLCLVVLAVAGPPASAHDFWIEPTAFTPAPAQTVGLRLRVGENWVGEPVVLAPRLVKQFVIDDVQQRRPVLVRAGGDPAGVFRVAQPGLQVVSYVNDPNRVDIDADKFNAYLAAEGLDHILALRAQRGQSDAAAREWYVRCAKSLLWSGTVAADTARERAPDRGFDSQLDRQLDHQLDHQLDRPLGLPLELVAEHNPYALVAFDVMPLRLLHHDRPLMGALVVAINSQQPTQRISARSDAQGRVRLPLPPSRGLWLVKAVHMVQAPANAEGVQWLSYWASLTFAAAPMGH
jgi:hypothetical protein